MRLPRTARGWLVTIFIISMLIIGYYAAAMGTVVLGAVVIGAALFLVYVIGRRITERLIHGKAPRRPAPEGGKE
jgi:hypothetical protein